MIKLNKILLIVLVAGLLWSCNKKDPDINGEISAEISSSVNAIAVDKKNTKWIGTNEGLFRSVEEGFQFMENTFSEEIYSLYYEESENLLWIGSDQGLSNIIISRNGIEKVTVPKEKLSNSKVKSIHLDKESKRWFGTDNGITLNYNENWKKEKFRINTKDKFFPMTIENFQVNSIASMDGDYFFATSGAKLYRAFDFDSSVDAFTGATQWDPPYNGLSISDTMFVVFIDNENRQWMGGKEGIQVHTGHDPKDMGSFTYYYDELPDPYVLTINQAPNNDIWVGTRKGLAVFDGNNWEIIKDSLPDLYISAIAFDEDGSIWVGTKKGLVQINK